MPPTLSPRWGENRLHRFFCFVFVLFFRNLLPVHVLQTEKKRTKASFFVFYSCFLSPFFGCRSHHATLFVSFCQVAAAVDHALCIEYYCWLCTYRSRVGHVREQGFDVEGGGGGGVRVSLSMLPVSRVKNVFFW